MERDATSNVIKSVAVAYDEIALDEVSSRTNMPKRFEEVARPNARIAFVTAITGGYDQTTKRPKPQTIPADFIVYTDNPDINTQGVWVVVNASRYREGLDESDMSPRYINSLKTNTHKFNQAKWFKMNLHRLPELQVYDVVTWLDGTVEITNEYTAADMLQLADAGLNIVVFEHNYERMETEVYNSHVIGRYATTFWRGQRQPFQDVDAQFDYYVSDGFNSKWFESIDPRVLRLWPKFGRSKLPTKNNYVTCFVVFDMRNPDSSRFLDMWRFEVLSRTTQDQISFPYVLYKMRLLPHSFPWPELAEVPMNFTNSYFKKLDHGL